MPRTISNKPAYSVRWWRENGYVAPKRDVFAILRAVAMFRYESPLPPLRGRVAATDARKIADRFADAKRRVSLVITSPPYLDTTNYREDQWLRLWFLGGPAKPELGDRSDDRHRCAATYWNFLTEAWAGITPLLRDGAHVVIRIGGRHIDSKTAEVELRTCLRKGSGAAVRLLDRRASRITHGQVHAFRPGTNAVQVEYDFHFRLS